MKGFIFTHFLEMVEEKYGFVVVDNIVQKSNLSTGGVYTAVGTYPFEELVDLLTNLSQEVTEEPNVLLRVFSYHFFDVLETKYAAFFKKASDAFEMFEKLDTYIHPEVQKLYPEADLPKFGATRLAPNKLKLVYDSEKMLGDFAEGLIQRCGEHFNENLTIDKQKLDEHGKIVQFIIIRE